MSNAYREVEGTRQSVDIDDLGDYFCPAAEESAIDGNLVGQNLGTVVGNAGVGITSLRGGVVPSRARQVENGRSDRPITLGKNHLDTFKWAA